MAIESQPQTQLQTPALERHHLPQRAAVGEHAARRDRDGREDRARPPGALTAFTASSDTSGDQRHRRRDRHRRQRELHRRPASRTAQISVSGAMTVLAGHLDRRPRPSRSRPAAARPPRRTTVHALSANLDDVVAAINGGRHRRDRDEGRRRHRRERRRPVPPAAALREHRRGRRVLRLRGRGRHRAGAARPPPSPQPHDASITLYGGTGAEQTVTSSSNTFTGLMTGVNVTVSAVTTARRHDHGDPRLEQGRDDRGAPLTGNLIALFSTIATDTAVTTSSSTSGGTSSTSTTGSRVHGRHRRPRPERPGALRRHRGREREEPVVDRDHPHEGRHDHLRLRPRSPARWRATRPARWRCSRRSPAASRTPRPPPPTRSPAP